jgi:hypothetical protein
VRDYARISPKFWTGETGRALRKHPNAQRLAVYLLTCPSANMIGVFYVAAPTICHEVGFTADELAPLWKVLADLDFAHYDHDREIVWVPNMAREQLDDALKPADRRVAGVVRQVDSIRRHPFARAFWERYAVAFSLATHPEAEGLVALFGGRVQRLEAVASPVLTPSKPSTSGKEDQEQEQDHAQEQDPDPPLSSPSAALGYPDRVPARSEERAEGFDVRSLLPRWQRYRMGHDATDDFLAVFARYPNQVGKWDAASAWQAIVEAGFPGGEPALRVAILARFDAGQLKQHPYLGEVKFRPSFETYLRGFRWLDADSAPSDAEPEKPVETLQQRDERAKREAAERRLAAQQDIDRRAREAEQAARQRLRAGGAT